MEVIKAEKLCKTYNKTPAADNISLSVKRGTVFGLIGANGAGKSTTIECILGTKTADSGNHIRSGNESADIQKAAVSKGRCPISGGSLSGIILPSQNFVKLPLLSIRNPQIRKTTAKVWNFRKSQKPDQRFIRRRETKTIYYPRTHTQS